MQTISTKRRFLRLPEVLMLTGLSRSTIYSFMKENNFPQSVSIGRRSVAWLENEVSEWLEQRIISSRDVEKIEEIKEEVS